MRKREVDQEMTSERTDEKVLPKTSGSRASEARGSESKAPRKSEGFRHSDNRAAHTPDTHQGPSVPTVNRPWSKADCDY